MNDSNSFFKAKLSNLVKPARVSEILKVSNRKNPSKAITPKRRD